MRVLAWYVAARALTEATKVLRSANERAWVAHIRAKRRLRHCGACAYYADGPHPNWPYACARHPYDGGRADAGPGHSCALWRERTE